MNANRYHVSKNLFDKSTAVAGYGVDNNSGGLFRSTALSASDYINISGESYIRATYITSGVANQYGAFYDNNKTYISGYSGYSNAIAVPQNAVYTRITARTEYIDELMLNTGSEALPYEPYSSEVWHDIPHYIHKTDTDTITTLPAVVYANDTTATVGLKGNMEQSGTPTPDSPIQPNECGERTGNLFDSDVLLEADGWEKHDNIYSGYSSALHSKFNSFDKCIPIDATVVNIKVMFKYENLNTTLFVIFWYTDGTSTSSSKNGKSGEWTYLTGESDSNKTLKGIAFSYGTNDLVELKEIMLNTGSTALPYEPYGYKIPILSAGQTTPVYLGEAQSTRRIKKYELTGNEHFYSAGQSGKTTILIYFSPSGIKNIGNIVSYNCSCSHYKIGAYYSPSENEGVQYTLVNLYFRIKQSSITDFITYLTQQYAAGTPVTVWYVLAEPTTGIVNEPIRKLGDYADTISNITIPTIAGANTISVGTTLQPSEVSVNYKGWHPVVNGHESESGQWD